MRRFIGILFVTLLLTACGSSNNMSAGSKRLPHTYCVGEENDQPGYMLASISCHMPKSANSNIYLPLEYNNSSKSSRYAAYGQLVTQCSSTPRLLVERLPSGLYRIEKWYYSSFDNHKSKPQTLKRAFYFSVRGEKISYFGSFKITPLAATAKQHGSSEPRYHMALLKNRFRADRRDFLAQYPKYRGLPLSWAV